MHILLVEDEEDLGKSITLGLEVVGFTVTHVTTGRTALDALAHGDYKLAILDLMLPDLTGLDICRQIRDEPRLANLAVLMLTARGETYDRVVGLEAGADDYLVKPFSMRELELRIRALLRRQSREGVKETQTDSIIQVGELKVDLAGHRVTVSGAEVQCTALEFKLLKAFLLRKGRVQSRQVLLDDVWGTDTFVTDRTVDTHVKRLREKLGELGASIETVRGVGYRFRDDRIQ
ncbi:MAG: response regulator transcription factor [Myxococcota bacterium]|nr:response regulator transcription factor [Myxococcota bacterium]